jgi:hypothetical protein
MVRKLLVLLTLCCGFAMAADRVYELRTYTCFPGKLEALKTRFRDHTIRIFKKHGMESIGYWAPMDDRKETTLVYIISHASREQADQNWKEFSADPEWKKVAADSETNAGGKIVQHVDRQWLQPTDFSQLK